MKKSQVCIPWEEGLHIRPCARLVKCAKTYKSSILLKTNNKLADARNILAIMFLCASFGTLLDIEVSGPDEVDALAAVQAVFDITDGPDGS